jgi:hypothetical protein
MKLLLLVLRNSQPADLVDAVLLTVFAFHHHHLKYDGLIDLLHSFQLLHKTALCGF